MTGDRSGTGLWAEFPPIFVISLRRSVERRRAICERLDALGLSYSIFDAIDGQQIDLHAHPAYARFRRRLFFGRDMTAGEFGCLLSHRSLYQFIVERRIACAAVLEDDAIVADDFPTVVAALMRASAPWDLVRFLARAKVYRNSRPIGRLVGQHWLTSVSGTPGGAYGYVLTERAARRLLRITRKNWVPIDTAHGQVWRTGLKAYAVRPSPVLPNDATASTIGDLRFDKTVQIDGWMRAVYPLTRFAWRLYETAGKRSSALAGWPERRRVRRRLRQAEDAATRA